MITIIASVLFAYYFVEVAGFPYKIKSLLKFKAHQRLKPLDCITCLSVWIAVILYFLPPEVSQFLATIFTAGLIGFLIQKL